MRSWFFIPVAHRPTSSGLQAIEWNLKDGQQ